MHTQSRQKTTTLSIHSRIRKSCLFFSHSMSVSCLSLGCRHSATIQIRYAHMYSVCQRHCIALVYIVQVCFFHTISYSFVLFFFYFSNGVRKTQLISSIHPTKESNNNINNTTRNKLQTYTEYEL